MRYFDPELNESYVPFVVETSIGIDRMFLQVISASYCEEELEKDSRVVLKIPPALAPVKLAVLPLVRKDGLPEIARKIVDNLKFGFNCQYDEKDSIGKRYRRQDARNAFCVTVDHQTAQDNTVTIGIATAWSKRTGRYFPVGRNYFRKSSMKLIENL